MFLPAGAVSGWRISFISTQSLVSNIDVTKVKFLSNIWEHGNHEIKMAGCLCVFLLKDLKILLIASFLSALGRVSKIPSHIQLLKKN